MLSYPAIFFFGDPSVGASIFTDQWVFGETKSESAALSGFWGISLDKRPDMDSICKIRFFAYSELACSGLIASDLRKSDDSRLIRFCCWYANARLIKVAGSSGYRSIACEQSIIAYSGSRISNNEVKIIDCFAEFTPFIKCESAIKVSF